MSVRVNLLPREYEERARTRRAAGIGLLVVLAWILLLAVLQIAKMGAISDVRAERDAAQAELSRLQAELAQLEQFQGLADQLATGNEVLAFAMAEEVSWSRVLNDLSLTFPATASLRQLDASLTDLAPTQPDTGEVFTANGEDVGTLIFEGYSIERYAPGVEVVLLRLEDVRSVFQAYLEAAAAEAIGDVTVTNFSGDAQLDEQARTQRYLDGLPPEGPR